MGDLIPSPFSAVDALASPSTAETPQPAVPGRPAPADAHRSRASLSADICPACMSLPAARFGTYCPLCRARAA